MLILATDRYLAIKPFGGARGRSVFMTDIGEARVFLSVLGNDDEEFIHSFSTVVEWRALMGLEAVDPYPSFSITWRHGRIHDSRVYRLYGELDDAAEREAAVVRMLEHVEARAPNVVRRGWLEAPEVDWEKVESWPSDGPVQSGYRKAAKERIVAKRAELSVLKSFFADDRLADCVTTETHLYARWLDVEGAWRVPLKMLRLGFAQLDATYVFGRRLRFRLKHRENCPVRKHLDSLLA